MHNLIRGASLIALMAIPNTLLAETPAGLNLDKGLAIEGYDLVAYFTQGAALEGSENITTLHDGATYQFSSADNRDSFLASPESYLPAYGGWCAWAMSDGELVDADPESFLMRDGRLFLFFDMLFIDTRNKWLKGEHAALAAEADGYWAQLNGAK